MLGLGRKWQSGVSNLIHEGDVFRIGINNFKKLPPFVNRKSTKFYLDDLVEHKLSSTLMEQHPCQVSFKSMQRYMAS